MGYNCRRQPAPGLVFARRCHRNYCSPGNHQAGEQPDECPRTEMLSDVCSTEILSDVCSTEMLSDVADTSIDSNSSDNEMFKEESQEWQLNTARGMIRRFVLMQRV